jgi:hypothetical protein
MDIIVIGLLIWLACALAVGIYLIVFGLIGRYQKRSDIDREPDRTVHRAGSVVDFQQRMKNGKWP